MSTGSSTCDIVIPGYTLTERIGAGGYAEVWRAEAPGGIAKAVKIVYGYCEDEFASQELKALERVKGVRHPFLLSLERFEVIGGRLAILTELADMSLEQRLRQCRTEGLPGVPREELLRYMADAAEALDFLSQRHSLLHLDIKPENLLILGDHIKVADFGLVKELATRTQNSLVSGMTPTYASPEMFDDDPSAFSDQYSLAIVYQEMLTGSLPFPGRTAAQLAKQHTQLEPQLMALTAYDRPVVGKALAKNPTQRFPSCKAFIDSLLNSGKSAVVDSTSARPKPVQKEAAPCLPSVVDTKPASSCVTMPKKPDALPVEPRDAATRPVKRQSEPLPKREAPSATMRVVREEVVDVPVPDVTDATTAVPPTLYVALGGLGTNVLCRMRALIAKRHDVAQFDERNEIIAVDTNRDDLREACSSRWASPLLSENTLHMPLKLPKCYDDARDILGWVSRRWLYNIPRSLETRGYRPLGRVALVDHSRQLISLIEGKVQKLKNLPAAVANEGSADAAKIRIIVVASTGGGTGSGTATDVANAARSVAAELGVQVEVHAMLLCTCFANSSASPLLAANTLALLAELKHITACGNTSSASADVPSGPFESNQSPFDHVYWLPVRPRTSESQDSVDAVAQYLAAEQVMEVGRALMACRNSNTTHEEGDSRHLRMRKCGVAALREVKQRFIDELAMELAAEVKQYWLSADTSRNWRQLLKELDQAEKIAASGASAGLSPNAPLQGATSADGSLALRGQFREHLSRMFATELLTHLQQRMATRDDRGRQILSVTDAKIIADSGYDVVESIAAAENRHSKETTRFSTSPILRPLIAAASDRYLSNEVAAFDPRQPDRCLAGARFTEGLATACIAVLHEALAKNNLAGALSSLVDRSKAIEAALAAATTDLIQCGYDRRTLIFAPKSGGDDADQAALQASRPSAALRPANVDDVIVVSEDSGISPQSFAARLQEIFPGIADAASRLHTRTDIEWEPLSA